MKDKDDIKDLFSEKLSNHEVPVRNDLWSGIQSQLGNTTASTVAVKTISSTVKWMIGIASSVVVVGTAVWIASPEKVIVSNEVKQTPITNNSVNPTVSNEVASSDINQESKSISLPRKMLSSKELVDNNLGNEMKLDNNSLSSFIPNLNKEATVTSEPIKRETPVVYAVSEPPLKVIIPESKEAEKTAPVVIIPDGKIEELFNVFTPNGDGVNDYFFLKNENLKDFTIRIFNERDQLVFESTDKDFKWFGYDLSGIMVEKGNYGYVIFATDLNGKSIKIFKNLTIR